MVNNVHSVRIVCTVHIAHSVNSVRIVCSVRIAHSVNMCTHCVHVCSVHGCVPGLSGFRDIYTVVCNDSCGVSVGLS